MPFVLKIRAARYFIVLNDDDVFCRLTTQIQKISLNSNELRIQMHPFPSLGKHFLLWQKPPLKSKPLYD